jgi:hypothetical protein
VRAAGASALEELLDARMKDLPQQHQMTMTVGAEGEGMVVASCR